MARSMKAIRIALGPERSQARARTNAAVRRWVLVAAATSSAVLALERPAAAQVNPADMRSGSLSVTTGGAQVDVFTVPMGQYFILTDLEWSTSSSDGDLGIVTLNLYGGGTRWRYRGVYQHVSGVYRAPFAVQSHLETGIVFAPGDVVRFENVSQISGRTYYLNWSGYLAPAGFSGADDPGSSILDGIEQNAPNPFQRHTQIDYAFSQVENAHLRVFDASGRLVRTLVDARQDAGQYSVGWDGMDDEGRALASGVYFYELSTDQGRKGQKALLLR